MGRNHIEIDSRKKIEQSTLKSKEKRLIYMSRLRNPMNFEYHPTEHQGNTSAMHKKHLEKLSYHTCEGYQNREHMTEIRH